MCLRLLARSACARTLRCRWSLLRRLSLFCMVRLSSCTCTDREALNWPRILAVPVSNTVQKHAAWISLSPGRFVQPVLLCN